MPNSYYRAYISTQELRDFADYIDAAVESGELEVEEPDRIAVAVYDNGDVDDFKKYGDIRFSTKHLTRSGLYRELAMLTFDPDL